MRRCFRLLVLALLILRQPATLSANDLAFTIRVLDDSLDDIFRLGSARSGTMQRLARELSSSDLIIHVLPCVSNCVHAGAFRFVTEVGEHRLVRIWIDVTQSDSTQLALLAHELQHAVELARAPAVRTHSAFAELFATIGFPTSWSRRSYDTVAARNIAQRVHAEIKHSAALSGIR